MSWTSKLLEQHPPASSESPSKNGGKRHSAPCPNIGPGRVLTTRKWLRDICVCARRIEPTLNTNSKSITSNQLLVSATPFVSKHTSVPETIFSNRLVSFTDDRITQIMGRGELIIYLVFDIAVEGHCTGDDYEQSLTLALRRSDPINH